MIKLNKPEAIFAAIVSTSTMMFGSAVLAQTSGEACAAFPRDQQSYACVCPAGPASGSVWGIGPYTADSNICAAAQHAGVIGLEGGSVTAYNSEGLAAYQGSQANGITTREWGSYPLSFVFADTIAECGRYPVGEPSYTCGCPENAPIRSVWGSSPYTADSDLCTAARHGGMIGPEGGTITALQVMGLPSYSASNFNEVSTSSWGSYGNSFVFNYNQ